MLKISSRTKVVAVLGYPLDYSLTAQLLNAAFDAALADFTCIPFEVKPTKLKDAMQAMRALGMTGANVAMPHKELVVPHLDRLGVTATMVGHVDTIGREGSQLVGHNSDFHAFLYSFREAAGTMPKGRTALLLGAGGAAMAVAAALLKEGAKELRIANRTPQRAEAMMRKLKKQFANAKIALVNWDHSSVGENLRDCDLLVNATPGDPLASQGPLILPRDIHGSMLVFDTNVSSSTPLLLAARQAGASIVPGTRMLLWHAIMSYRLWTLQEAPVPAMEKALGSMLGSPINALNIPSLS